MSVRAAAPAMVALAIFVSLTSPAVAGSVPAKGHDSKPSSLSREKSVPQAPGGPPLTGEGAAVEGEASSAPPSGGNALVENGLGSPMCRAQAQGLSSAALRSCELAGFLASPYPIGDYALDVNIDTGVTKVTNDISATIQNFTGFAWMVFVSITQGLIVMLEWCYSLDRLTGELLGGIASALQRARLSVTDPWLPATLSLAAALVAYHGLVRRRVAETLGQALAMFAMMATGLWLIADPAGTIGVLDHWANQAGLGTLGAVATGSPEEPERTFAGDMRRLFTATIDSPWCYMEFGNVGWCKSALDPGLRAAALAIADREQSESGCRALCDPGAGPKARTLAASAALLHEARSNGELFLALPADEAARNSTKDGWSLLSVLCGGEGRPSDKCAGTTAAQAEFRSAKGTQPRLIGLCLVWLGGLGMLAVLGFLALHLLTAAIRTIVFLLLAPAAVLAPAFGDSGRSLFRTWLTRLLAAAVSKLIYSFLLGVVLLMVYLLLRLTMLGWWGQWLVLSAFWWGVFVKRHEISAVIEGPAQNRQGARHRLLPRMRSPLRKTTDKIKEKLRSPAPDPPERPPSRKDPDQTTRKPEEGQAKDRDDTDGETDRSRSTTGSAEEPPARPGDRDAQAMCTLDRDHEQAAQRVGSASENRAQISAGQEKLGRLRHQRAKALEEGDTLRATKLDVRAGRVEREISRQQQGLNQAHRVVADAETAKRLTGSTYTPEQLAQRSRFLQTQAALPPRGRRTAQGVGRDYVALSGLAGYGSEEYSSLAPREQREARLEIDRALAGLAPPSGQLTEGAPPERDGGQSESPRSNGRGDSEEGSHGRSPVMDDAFAVQNRRKRQLGREMPQ